MCSICSRAVLLLHTVLRAPKSMTSHPHFSSLILIINTLKDLSTPWVSIIRYHFEKNTPEEEN